MKQLTSPFDLIKKAINIFAKKENAFFLVKICLPILPFTILSIIQGYIPRSVIDSNAMWFTLGLGLLQILSLLTGVFVAAAGITALGKVVEGGELSVKKTFSSSWKYYWTFLLLSIVLVLSYLLGFILLVIPGLLFIVWFAFSRFIAIEKGAGVTAAIKKSKELVKGIYWKILGRLIIFGMFAVIVQMILSVIPYGVGSIVSSLLGGFYMLPLYLLYKEVSA
jgi:hypothetical protein